MFKLNKLKASVDKDNSVVIYTYDGAVPDKRIINIWDNIVNQYKSYNKLNLDDCLDMLNIFYNEVLSFRKTIDRNLDVDKLFTKCNFKIYHIKHAEGKIIKRVAILSTRVNEKIGRDIIRSIVRFEYVDDSDALIKSDEIVKLSKSKESVLDEQSEK